MSVRNKKKPWQSSHRGSEEFQGRYARSREVDAILAAKRAGRLNKRDLRYFFAMLEDAEQRGVRGIDAILNPSGQRRITKGQQEEAQQAVMDAVKEFKPEKELSTKIPRKFLKTAAAGRLGVSEMITALFYFRWRMPQRVRRTSLVRCERYARFTYEKVSHVTGLARATVCEAMKVLRKLRVISVVWRPMAEIKRFGMLFVDGPATSLFFTKDERSRRRCPTRRVRKQRTDTTENTNAPRCRTIYKTLPRNSLQQADVKKSSWKRESKEVLFARLRRRCRLEYGVGVS